MINPVSSVRDRVTLFTVLQGTCVLETVKLALLTVASPLITHNRKLLLSSERKARGTDAIVAALQLLSHQDLLQCPEVLEELPRL